MGLIQHFAPPAGDDLLVLERGEGPFVFDTHGRRYVDALSSLFCAQIGYSYGEEMAAAAATQLTTLPFNTNWNTAHPPALALAEELAERAPGDLDHVFFTSGGSEAVEAAWKLAREHFLAIGEPQRLKAIARDVAYHGVTLGALSFTGVERFKTPFGRPAIDVTHVSNTLADVDHLQEMEDAILAAGPDEVALIIAEPVQNAGGCLVPPDGYWRGLRELADKYGILLMADEVITGCGRMGEWFGIAREGVVPDLVSLAKGLTSAYAPMGAVVARERVMAPITGAFRHGITFGGHPVCAAIARKNIEIIERDGIFENVYALEQHLADRMQDLLELEIVTAVRGAGFFWAAQLRDDAVLPALSKGLREAGLIARCDNRGDPVVQIAPPLISDAALLDEIVERLAGALSAVEAQAQPV